MAGYSLRRAAEGRTAVLFRGRGWHRIHSGKLVTCRQEAVWMTAPAGWVFSPAQLAAAGVLAEITASGGTRRSPTVPLNEAQGPGQQVRSQPPSMMSKSPAEAMTEYHLSSARLPLRNWKLHCVFYRHITRNSRYGDILVGLTGFGSTA
jgi:hypothetical protein